MEGVTHLDVWGFVLSLSCFLFRVTRWREGERGADGVRVVSVSLPLVLLRPVRSAMGGWDSAI